MKAKQIKRSILAILMIAVFMVGTSVVSVGAATQKTYLNTMGYSSFNTDCKLNFSAPYDGKDRHGNQCTNANQFNIESNWEYYSNPDEVHDRGYVSYTITYDLNKKYNNFIFSLTVNEIAAGSVELSILGDNSLIYGNGVSKGTNQTPVSINVKDVDIITFELTAPTTKPGYVSSNSIILNDAYFTSEGATPEPTTKVPDTTQKPTQAPTKPVENPTTVAPTTKNPVVTPTKNVEDTTETSSSEETTSSKINPTASTNATSKISTSDTATKDGANKGIANISNNKGNSDNSTIQTGAVSIAVVLFVILASLATGGFVWYRRKIK